jgi:hypothetical protein
MADYKGIKGFKVQYLSADPSDPIVGQTWYNSTSKDLKYTEFAAAAWATGGALNTGRSSLSAMGTQDAGLAACGFIPGVTAATEEYNGATWTTVSSAADALYGRSGIGIQTAAVVAGGGSPPSSNTELYDGTTWTSNPTGLNTARVSMASAGVTAAGAIFGGNTGAADVGTTEEWNGSTWSTSPGSMTTGRRTMAGTGTQTAALCFGGQTPGSPTDATEEYDGTSWTAGGNLPSIRAYNRGAGTQTSTLGFGGSDPSGNISNTILYDGTSWATTSGTLGTPRTELGGTGTSSLALAAGGDSSSTATEEYTGAGPATKTITVS